MTLVLTLTLISEYKTRVRVKVQASVYIVDGNWWIVETYCIGQEKVSSEVWYYVETFFRLSAQSWYFVEIFLRQDHKFWYLVESVFENFGIWLNFLHFRGWNFGIWLKVFSKKLVFRWTFCILEGEILVLRCKCFPKVGISLKKKVDFQRNTNRESRVSTNYYALHQNWPKNLEVNRKWYEKTFL